MKVKNYKIDKAIKTLSANLLQANQNKQLILSKAKLVLSSSHPKKRKWAINYFEPMAHSEGNHGYTYLIDLNDLSDSIVEVTNDYFNVYYVYRAIRIGNVYVENYREIIEADLRYLLNISTESEEIWQLDYACKNGNQNEMLFLMLKVSVEENKVIFEEVELKNLNNKN